MRIGLENQAVWEKVFFYTTTIIVDIGRCQLLDSTTIPYLKNMFLIFRFYKTQKGLGLV